MFVLRTEAENNNRPQPRQKGMRRSYSAPSCHLSKRHALFYYAYISNNRQYSSDSYCGTFDASEIRPKIELIPSTSVRGHPNML